MEKVCADEKGVVPECIVGCVEVWEWAAVVNDVVVWMLCCSGWCVCSFR